MSVNYLEGSTPFYSDNYVSYYMQYVNDALIVYRANRSTNTVTDTYLVNGERKLDLITGSSFHSEIERVYEELSKTLLFHVNIPFFEKDYYQFYASIELSNIVIRAMDDLEGRLLAVFFVLKDNYWKTKVWQIKNKDEHQFLKQLTLKAQRAFYYEFNRRCDNGR